MNILVRIIQPILILLTFSITTTVTYAATWLPISFFGEKLPKELHGETRYFSQLVDHNDASLGTFEQRYFVDESNAQGDHPPVFFIACGEGLCGPDYLNRFQDAFINRYHPIVVALEHRYYGKSLPRPTFSNEDLKFLTIEQALADLQSFQLEMMRNKGWDGKWVIFGRSYPGMLAAFYRSRHPELVVGALASSAPVQFNLQTAMIDEDVTTQLDTMCAAKMREAIFEVESALEDPAKIDLIKAGFQAEAFKDNRSVLELMTMITQGAVQFGFGKSLCSAVENSPTPLQGIQLIAKAAFKNSGLTALHFVMEGSESTDPAHYENKLAFGIRQWNYQICSQIGLWSTASPDRAQSSESVLLDVNYYLEKCQRYFGVTAAPEPESMNRRYLEPLLSEATNIFFTNGSRDPYRLYSLDESNSPNPNLSYYTIQGATHGADFDKPKWNDSPDILAARDRLFELVGKWLND